MKKILVLTSGGDAPGMNAAIRAVVRSGYYYGVEILACHNGFQGLVDQEIFVLEKSDVANTIQHGGTILRSSRCRDFYKKVTRDKCREFLAANDIDGLIVIGGEGSFHGAALFAAEGGSKSIGIPATIDNDIIGTEYSIGYDTARNTALKAIDNIRDTASSNNRYFLVEVMGQRAGFLALDVGIAGGAEYIVVPEFPITTEELIKQIMEPRRIKQSLIIVIAEAGEPGRSLAIAETLENITPFDYRVCILGHIQRGGIPTVMDREIASRMGHLAVTSLIESKSNLMTAIEKGQLLLNPYPDPESGYRKLEDAALLDLGRVLAS